MKKRRKIDGEIEWQRENNGTSENSYQTKTKQKKGSFFSLRLNESSRGLSDRSPWPWWRGQVRRPHLETRDQ